VCFNGKGIYETVTKSTCKIGMQPKLLEVGDGVYLQCYVMPSTSARVKAYTREQKLDCLKEIKLYLEQLIPEKEPTNAANNNVDYVWKPFFAKQGKL